VDSRPSAHSQRNRVRIAQVTARLIAEHGLTDWNLAKRKARRELGLPDREALPDDDEVEQALRDYNTLFRQADQPVRLRAQRLEALAWMRRLAEWRPVLTGAVAAGWATAHSEVRIELEAEDAKAVELCLINAGVEYDSAPPSPGHSDRVQLRIDGKEASLRLIVVSPVERRNRRRSGPGTEDRLNAEQLETLLAERSS
jgi:hypothetical protein